MKEYNVNDTIYLSLKRGKTILPAKIAEKIVKQKIDTREVTYNIVLPGRDLKMVALESLDAHVFKSLKDLKEDFLKNAETIIATGISKCMEIESEFFPKQVSAALHVVEENQPNPTIQKILTEEPEPQKIVMPDGSVANFKGP